MRISTRHLTLPALALTLGLLLSAAPSGAQSDGVTPVAPSNGKIQHRGVPFTFKVRATTDTGVFLKVSKSKKLGADGTLASNVYFRSMSLNGGLYTKKVERYPALTSFFLNRPGRYYWQAYRIECPIDGGEDCNVEGPVRSLHIR
jgi:hypothetical protein